MTIYGPVDIEVHLGSDNRYYLIDAARTFAPTTPEAHVRWFPVIFDIFVSF